MIEIKNLDGKIIETVEGDTLMGVDLRWANLEGADFRGANLWRADLREANLWGADLRWANLFKANFEGADLSKAELAEANFRGANLWGATLWETNLEGADFRGANFWRVKGIFVNQINGSKDPLIFLKYGENLKNNQLQIGCLIHSLDFWLENYQEIGLNNEYSEKEIEEYGKYIQSFSNE
jgi:uncharacterized protein YjbI with pentapeptide repeats